MRPVDRLVGSWELVIGSWRVGNLGVGSLGVETREFQAARPQFRSWPGGCYTSGFVRLMRSMQSRAVASKATSLWCV